MGCHACIPRYVESRGRRISVWCHFRQKAWDCIWKITKQNNIVYAPIHWNLNIAQLVGCFFFKREALSSKTPITSLPQIYKVRVYFFPSLITYCFNNIFDKSVLYLFNSLVTFDQKQSANNSLILSSVSLIYVSSHANTTLFGLLRLHNDTWNQLI
jgi:hypothetical protein